MVYGTLGEGFVHQNLRNFTFKSVNFGALNGSSLNFLQAGCSSWRPTNCVKALKALGTPLQQINN